MFHFGVMRALHKQRMLPHIICGTSIGALLAALLGVRRDDELEQLWNDPSAIKFDAFDRLGVLLDRRQHAIYYPPPNFTPLCKTRAARPAARSRASSSTACSWM